MTHLVPTPPAAPPTTATPRSTTADLPSVDGNSDGATSTPADFPQPTLIPVNGIELEVFEAGREHAGNPIVLCHGWPELAYSWRHQIPALVAAGFHVIAPNQRGFGNSSRPAEVTAYDLTQLTDDLVGLLDHFGYADATFVGHDWGATVVWGLAQLHPERVSRVINLSVPFFARGEAPWVEMLAAIFGSEFYYVHFNRQPGVADAILDANAERFLGNLFRQNVPLGPPEEGMAMINLAHSDSPAGDPLQDDGDLAIYVAAFQTSGFTPGINWYRNSTRNWHLLADFPERIQQPTLMIYGSRDTVPRAPDLHAFVPNVEEVTLDAGHWIQQERPTEVNAAILDWLASQD